MKSKQGLSTVVTTLIIILLVLVAIGIVWVVVRGVVESGSEQIGIQTKCPSIDLRIIGNSSTCSVGTCNVDIERRSGGENIDGVRVVISNSTLSNITTIGGNIDQLTTKTLTVGSVAAPTKISAAAYFNDASNNPQFCTNSVEFNI